MVSATCTALRALAAALVAHAASRAGRDLLVSAAQYFLVRRPNLSDMPRRLISSWVHVGHGSGWWWTSRRSAGTHFSR